MHEKLNLPASYRSGWSVIQTETAIKLVKDTFEQKLARRLSLTRVSAPLFVRADSGLNDNLNGVERPVAFDVPCIGGEVAEIVHSLAKWKRLALSRYGFEAGSGLYTDMNAVRRDEVPDQLHSLYVDQWDWEKVITRETRTVETLKETVREVLAAIRETEDEVCPRLGLTPFIPGDIAFITAQELLDRYPGLSPKEREDAAAKEYGAVFIMGIGDKLSDGKPHDGRAPDYDDWALNGDILFWYPVLNRAVEISSMGIRVDASSLHQQLQKAGCPEREGLYYHRLLLEGELPLTIGGGIGQSRLCMLLLQRAHIGEVQASLWDEETISACAAHGVTLL